MTGARYPWTYEAALDAIKLRRLGMGYTSIALALQHFHGFRPSRGSVTYICRKGGIPPMPQSNSHRTPFTAA